MQQLRKDYQRIVIKIGSSLLKNAQITDQIIAQIAALVNSAESKHLKREVILVSSGAVAYGMGILGLKSRPTKLSHLQAAASLGQSQLMELYKQRFAAYKIKCAQILLTWDDFDDRNRYLNAKNTLQVLLNWGSLPIINENDTVSVDEIKFGDNDRLAALVANLIDADILIILSDVDGFIDPKTSEVIPLINKINNSIEKLASSSDKATSVGGMKTKLSAAKIAMQSQIPCLIVNGKKNNILDFALRDPCSAGTLFVPVDISISARKKWFVFCARPKGKICVDNGAKNALLAGKSLLPVGVVGFEGNFMAGDIIEVTDKQGVSFARGKVNCSSRDLENIKGKQKMKEVVHCDNLVLNS